MTEVKNQSDIGSDIKFDALIVGGGPAGTSAALKMAEAGLKVALIERGSYPGAKNVMGGVLYRHAAELLVPDFWKEAPLERHIIEQQYWVLSDDSNVSVSHRSEKFTQPPFNRFTVLRAKYDAWFAKKADEAGAYIIPKTVVRDLITRDGKVIGISTDRPEGDLYGDVVILCDGVNSLLAKKAGMRREVDRLSMNPPRQQETRSVALAVKEIIAMPRGKIEDRFNLEGEEGATIDIYGAVAHGMEGTGFIYTNKESLSVGIGIILEDLIKTRIRPYDLLEEMKNHPVVRRIIAGGEPREYLAHMIPEGGYNAMPKVYGDGVLVAGDAAMMVNGFHREGSNLAMTSGRLAAETVIHAKEVGDFSARTLVRYRELLEDSFVLKDLKKYRNLPAYIASHPEIFSIYPEMINQAADEFLTIDGIPKKEKQSRIRKIVKKYRSTWGIIKDIYRSWRAFG